jgi:hypothetical protein
MAKRGEFPVLPREVTSELRAIQLFMAYLDQRATRDSIYALAHGQNRLREVDNHMHTVMFVAARPKTVEDLRRLMTAAPALDALVDLARQIPDEVMPPAAIPSYTCMLHAMEAYHRWVQAQARRH